MTHADVWTPTPTAPKESPLPPGLAFELLANERRRALAAHLLAVPRVVTVEELADVLADADTDATRVASKLHHVHLPKLEAAGVIEWDEPEHVEGTELLADLEPFLRAAATLEGQVR
jgi:hypothetical protein